MSDLSDSRRRLFETAIELFGKHGYHGVSVKDLTDALGIKPPSLYSHVSSKQVLLFELALIGVRGHTEALRDGLLESLPDPREQVRSLVRAHVLVHLNYPDLARIISQEIRHLDAERRMPIAQLQAESSARLRDVLDRGVRLGAFVVPDLPRAMRLIADLGIGAAAWADRTTPAEHDAIADYYADSVLLIIRAAGTHSAA